MKQYVYDGNSPMIVFDMGGKQFNLYRGDIITYHDMGEYKYGDHHFIYNRKDLKKDFHRLYTPQQENRYERIEEQAIIAAMQSMIARISGNLTDINDVEVVTKNAILFGKKLVEDLKEREF